MSLPRETLEAQMTLQLDVEPQQIVPGLWTTGEITSRSEAMGASQRHMVRDGTGWISDPYWDDMALVIEGTGGLILLCGCCHAGLLNTLSHVRRRFDRDPVAILGGTHLAGASDEHLRHLVEVLLEIGSPALHLNHCTGDGACRALARAFGDRVSPCPAGTQISYGR